MRGAAVALFAFLAFSCSAASPAGADRDALEPMGAVEAQPRFRAKVLYWEDKAANR